MNRAAPAIEVEEIFTRFGGRTIHDGISLTIERGEVFAIVGGSGSGKTTLMREMALLERPTRGRIRLFGREVTALSERETRELRRHLGVMFQHGALFNDLTVLENVAVPLKEHTHLSRPVIEELAMVKILLAGLAPEAAHLYPSQLSGGMLKRAAVARAIALDPELLFLDEPASGLDPRSAEALDDLVLRLRDSLGLTVVMVTHDLESLWRVADRVVLIGDARILGIGTMDALANAADPAIRRFFRTVRTARGDTTPAWTQK